MKYTKIFYFLGCFYSFKYSIWPHLWLVILNMGTLPANMSMWAPTGLKVDYLDVQSGLGFEMNPIRFQYHEPHMWLRDVWPIRDTNWAKWSWASKWTTGFICSNVGPQPKNQRGPEPADKPSNNHNSGVRHTYNYSNFYVMHFFGHCYLCVIILSSLQVSKWW